MFYITDVTNLTIFSHDSAICLYTTRHHFDWWQFKWY